MRDAQLISKKFKLWNFEFQTCNSADFPVYFLQDINVALNSAASNEGNEELSRPVNGSDASTSAVKKLSGNGLKEALLLSPKHHKDLQKHHGKRHHRRHQHHHRRQHHHRPASAEAKMPNPSPAISFSEWTVEPRDFLEDYAQITPASSVDNELVSTQMYRYAAADKASHDSQIKIAKIGNGNASPTPTIIPVSKIVTTSMPPNQSVPGNLN